MQIKVNGGTGSAFNLAALQTAFKATSLGGQGVFQNGQNPIIVGQGAYNSAYGTSFQNNGRMPASCRSSTLPSASRPWPGEPQDLPSPCRSGEDDSG